MQIPEELVTDEFVLRPIKSSDAEADYAAVMDTREDLRAWRQSTWPEDDFTVEANRKDVATMVERRAARRAFDYTVLDPTRTTCLGCVYVFPPTATFLARATVTPLGVDAWGDVDAAVYFWTRRAKTSPGADARLLAALRVWFAGEWGLERAVFVVSEQFEHQVVLVAEAGMVPRSEIRRPDAPGAFYACR
ncbi:hypothetical protein GCM10027063_14680 [Promicromonospora xylanilytica]